MTVAGETHRCPPSEVLAAFIDGRLPRMKVEALTEHLASCAECRFVVESASELEAEEQAEVEPKGRHSWRWMAVAAMVGVVVLTSPFVWTMLRLNEPEIRQEISLKLHAAIEWAKSPRTYGTKVSVRELIAAADASKVRVVEPRVTGFGYAPAPPTFRSGSPQEPEDEQTIVKGRAATVLLQTENDHSPEALYAHGIASLVLGNEYRDRAITDLTAVTQQQPRNAQAWSDLAAAYLRKDQPKEAIDAANRALALDPKLDEARFNKALALNTIPGWNDYLQHDSQSRWAIEARRHKDDLERDLRNEP